MVEKRDEAACTIARLEVRVAALENKLAGRSAWIRAWARDTRDDDLVKLCRAALGLPPIPRAGLRGEAAAREMAAKWTWDHAAKKIVGRLDALSA